MVFRFWVLRLDKQVDNQLDIDGKDVQHTAKKGAYASDSFSKSFTPEGDIPVGTLIFLRMLEKSITTRILPYRADENAPV